MMITLASIGSKWIINVQISMQSTIQRSHMKSQLVIYVYECHKIMPCLTYYPHPDDHDIDQVLG